MLYNEMNRYVTYTRMIEQNKNSGRRNGRDSLGTILALTAAYGLMAFVIICLLIFYLVIFEYNSSESNHIAYHIPEILSALSLIALRVYRHKNPAGICGNIGMVLLLLPSIVAGWSLCYVAKYSFTEFPLIRWIEIITFDLLVMIIPLSYWAELIYKAIRNARIHHVTSSLSIT